MAGMLLSTLSITPLHHASPQHPATPSVFKLDTAQLSASALTPRTAHKDGDTITISHRPAEPLLPASQGLPALTPRTAHKDGDTITISHQPAEPLPIELPTASPDFGLAVLARMRFFNSLMASSYLFSTSHASPRGAVDSSPRGDVASPPAYSVSIKG